MSVTSPTSASPSLSLLEWDEPAVQSYLSHIGLPQYEDAIFEQGITGDVLAMMDHEALQDLGMGSIGHRLNVLKSVWELKREQGIALGEDDWRPTDVDAEEKKISISNIERLMALIVEQQERLVHLERNHARLLSSLEESGMRVAVQQLEGLDLDGKRNVPWRDFGHRQSVGEEVDAGPSKASSRASKLFPSSLASSTTTNHTAPLSSDSATFQDSFTPTTTSTSYPFDSPQTNTSTAAKPTTIQPPPLTRLMSGSSIVTTASPSSSQASQSLSSSIRSLAPGSIESTTSLAKVPNSVSPTPPQANGTISGERSKARDAANNAAKSFKVTLDDPCWKVLPAALKKYHIKDDWRYYALFLCFGVTERCMSYDERPLLLFQRLKEEGSKPVFMLRHLRDIKSPLAIAQHKQAVKLGLPATSKDVILPELKPADATSTSPTKMSGLKPGRRPEDGITPAGSAFPELPSPGIKDGETGAIIAPRSATHRTLPDKDGNPVSVYYAVAIYPYVADRQDEFDVAIGACYVVLSRTKGWYIVQRDPSGVGKIVVDHSKSGWVPAGCLIELHTPIGVLSAGLCDPAYPGLGPLLPSGVTSSTNNAIVLMKWEAKDSDQFTIHEGEELKVYKRYCHWSYAIRPSTGERGWVPSWFLGKQPSASSTSGTGAESQLASAATPTGTLPQQTPSTGSSGVTIIEEHKDRDGE